MLSKPFTYGSIVHCGNDENHFSVSLDTRLEFDLLPCGCPDTHFDDEGYGTMDMYLNDIQNIDYRTDEERNYVTLDDRNVVVESPTISDIHNNTLPLLDVLLDSDKFLYDILAKTYKLGEAVPFPKRLLPSTSYKVKVEYVVGALNTGNPFFSRPRTFCPSCFEVVNRQGDDGVPDEDGIIECGYTELANLCVEYEDETLEDGLLYLQMEHRPAHALCQEWGIEEAINYVNQRHFRILEHIGAVSIQEELFCDVCDEFVMTILY